jgi:hypothetical protein
MFIVELVYLLLELIDRWHHFLIQVFKVIIQAVPRLQLLFEGEDVLFVRFCFASVPYCYLDAFDRLKV